MPLLTAQQVYRVFDVTDSLLLHRRWIDVRVLASEVSTEAVLPDGRVLILAPSGRRFSRWLEGLRARLSCLDFSRTRRSDRSETSIPRLPEPPQDLGGEG